MASAFDVRTFTTLTPSRFQFFFSMDTQSQLVITPTQVPQKSEVKDTSKDENPSPSRKRKRIKESVYTSRFRVEPPGENPTDEERALRIAEAEILFAQYMASMNSARCKRTKSTGRSEHGRYPLLYLPSKSYENWDGYYQCSPHALEDISQKSRIGQLFGQDCREPGQPVAKYGPNPIELDSRHYDQEWNQRVNSLSAPVMESLEYGSLDNKPTFAMKRVKRPENSEKMDNFIRALRTEMGASYVDRNELCYFPRSNGRVGLVHDDDKGNPTHMKNSHLDMDLRLRHREINQKLEIVKEQHRLAGFTWNDFIEQMWEDRIVKFVDPIMKAQGRSHFLEQEELGIKINPEMWSPPERMDTGYNSELHCCRGHPPINRPADIDVHQEKPETALTALDEICDGLVNVPPEDLGTKVYWSESRQGIVSMEEMRMP
jgi:hypothetical protein